MFLAEHILGYAKLAKDSIQELTGGYWPNDEHECLFATEIGKALHNGNPNVLCAIELGRTEFQKRFGLDLQKLDDLKAPSETYLYGKKSALDLVLYERNGSMEEPLFSLTSVIEVKKYWGKGRHNSEWETDILRLAGFKYALPDQTLKTYFISFLVRVGKNKDPEIRVQKDRIEEECKNWEQTLLLDEMSDFSLKLTPSFSGCEGYSEKSVPEDWKDCDGDICCIEVDLEKRR